MTPKERTPYQKGIIKRYYENRDTIALQKLGETVSNLYLETSEAKITSAWDRAYQHLLAAGVHEHQAKTIVEDRDLGALARLLAELN